MNPRIATPYIIAASIGSFWAGMLVVADWWLAGTLIIAATLWAAVVGCANRVWREHLESHIRHNRRMTRE